MFRQIQPCLLLVLCTILASCSSQYYFQIDTLKPAKITLLAKGSNSRIMLVNNAITQPNNVGFNFEVSEGSNKVSTDLPDHYTDTLIWKGLLQMGHELENTHFFEEVYLYNQPIRKDDQWMSIIPLSENDLKELYEKSGCETIISIDRVLFLYDQKALLMPSQALNLNLKSQVGINCSVYHYGNIVPDTSFIVTDSLMYTMGYVIADSTDLSEVPKAYLSQNTRQTFQKIAWDITPEWQSSVRTIYTNRNSRMQDAFVYAKKEKWDIAAERWLMIYQDEKKAISKARLAQNIAVSFEARDNIDMAIEWMELCNTYYQQDAKSDFNEKAIAKEYLQALQQRIADNKLLDIQLK